MPRVAGEFARRMKVKRPTVGPLKLIHPCDSSIVVEVLRETGVKYPRVYGPVPSMPGSKSSETEYA